MITLSKLDENHIAAAALLSQEARWPHRESDWTFLLAQGQGIGVFDGASLVGTTMWWPQGERHATLGMVLVKRSHQRKGLGSKMMRAALEAMPQNHILLHATQEGVSLYKNMGFRDVGRIAQCQGVPTTLPDVPSGFEIKPAGEEDWPIILAMDYAARGWNRSELLRALAKCGGVYCAFDQDNLVGYAITRPFGLGAIIGPIVSADLSVAKALISHLLNLEGPGFMRLDVFQSSELVEWLSGFGLVQVDQSAVMVRGEGSAMENHAHSLLVLASHALG